MIRLTARLEEDIYKKLLLFSKDKNISINKALNEILLEGMNKSIDISILEYINKQLTNIENKLISISKKQHFHFDLSLQHFVNQGYFENGDPKKDKCYLELQEKYKDKYNE